MTVRIRLVPKHRCLDKPIIHEIVKRFLDFRRSIEEKINIASTRVTLLRDDEYGDNRIDTILKIVCTAEGMIAIFRLVLRYRKESPTIPSKSSFKVTKLGVAYMQYYSKITKREIIEHRTRIIVDGDIKVRPADTWIIQELLDVLEQHFGDLYYIDIELD